MSINLLVLSSLCGVVAYLAMNVFGLRGIAVSLATISMCFMCVFWFAAGMLGAYKGIDSCEMHRVEDGKNEVRITLKLGPWGYTVVVPESKQTEQPNAGE